MKYGEMPFYGGETPEKNSDDRYSYTFTEWLPSFKEVTEEAEYTAQFSKTPIAYYVGEYKNGGAVVASPQKGEYSVIFAAYDKNNVLIGINVVNVSFEEAGETEVKSGNFFEMSECSVRVLMWETLNGMVPIAASK